MNTRALKRHLQTAAEFEAMLQCALDQFGRHEGGCTCPVAGRFELARSLLQAKLHDACMPSLKQAHQVGIAARDEPHLRDVADNAPGAEHIMCILRPLGGDDAAEDDVSSPRPPRTRCPR